MNERQWRACTDPAAMLAFLRDSASERKLRLFACACCRVLGPGLTGEPAWRAVATAEEYADGRASAAALSRAGLAATCPVAASATLPDAIAAAEETSRGALAWRTALRSAERLGLLEQQVLEAEEDAVWRTGAARGGPAAVRSVRRRARHRARQAAEAAAAQAEAPARAFDVQKQCDVLRDLFGNPFRRPTLAPELRAWQGGVVVSLARALYQERRWQDLPILADALEEAGCTDRNFLDHYRRPGEHFRGCWAVDVVLALS
jgi:hypothetical protein